MTDAAWTAIATIVSAVAGISAAWFAFMAKRQGKRNATQLTKINSKVGEILDAPQVLLVDHDANDLLLMAVVFRKFNADIFEARTAHHALSLLQARVGSGFGLPFHLVIIDIRMQGEDAQEIVAAFEQAAPWVPLALITGRPDGGVIEELCRGRSLIILIKPLDEKIAEDTLRKLHIPFNKTP